MVDSMSIGEIGRGEDMADTLQCNKGGMYVNKNIDSDLLCNDNSVRKDLFLYITVQCNTLHFLFVVYIIL